MKPFEDDAAVITIGDLSIENGMEAIAVHGSLDIERTEQGLERARKLRDALAAIVVALEAAPAPIAAASVEQTPRTVANPLRRS